MAIRLRGRGRRDVPSSAFDDGRPIILYLTHGEILSLVGEPVSVPEERLAPKAKVVDSGLAIGPGVIGRNQIITYTVLACETGRPNGEPALTFRGSLIDVKVQPRVTLSGLAFFVGASIVLGLLYWIGAATGLTAIKAWAVVIAFGLVGMEALNALAAGVPAVLKLGAAIRRYFM